MVVVVDCFWRVRSGQRLDQSVVCDSLTVKSAVDCQIECLRSYRFVCRSYSFRYGSPVIGGAIDNCQLTDWPLHELNPKHHFVPEPGFEIYHRASYGHGCEPRLGGTKNGGFSDPGAQLDQSRYWEAKFDLVHFGGFSVLCRFWFRLKTARGSHREVPGGTHRIGLQNGVL